jgi:hypothetical protein
VGATASKANLVAGSYRKIAMESFTYRCYDDGLPPNPWKRWYDTDADKRTRAKHDSVWRILESLSFWRAPHVDYFRNEGLLEIRIVTHVQWRIFGFGGPTTRLFTVTGIGYHKGKVYSPKDIIAVAHGRKLEIEAGKLKAPICERPR